MIFLQHPITTVRHSVVSAGHVRSAFTATRHPVRLFRHRVGEAGHRVLGRSRNGPSYRSIALIPRCDSRRVRWTDLVPRRCRRAVKLPTDRLGQPSLGATRRDPYTGAKSLSRGGPRSLARVAAISASRSGDMAPVHVSLTVEAGWDLLVGGAATVVAPLWEGDDRVWLSGG